MISNCDRNCNSNIDDQLEWNRVNLLIESLSIKALYFHKSVGSVVTLISVGGYLLG